LGGKTILQKKKRILVIFIVFLLFFSLTNQVLSSNVVAQENETPEKPKGLLQLLGVLLAKSFPIIRFAAESAAADPSVIEISYGENVTVDIGMLNLTTNEFELFDRPRALFDSRSLTFEVVEYPGGNEYGKWLVTFNPVIITVERGVLLKTNASISLRSPRMADVPIQSGILKIRVNDKWVFGDIYRPVKGGHYDKLGMRMLWFILSITGGWGRELSGRATVDQYDIDILVKVKPFHSVKFDSVPYIVVRPDQIVSIPVSLQNLGNYNDTFSFRVVSDRDDIKIAEPMSITLAPGETKDAFLGVTVPPRIFDFGTLYNIDLEAYSIYEENITTAVRTVTFESKGAYFSEISSMGIFFLIFILILLVIFIIFRRRRLLENICVKPDKPWDIPEEEKYLERLKQQDKQKYNKVLEMMDDEYKSALLWYDNYVKSVIQPKPIKKEKIKKVKKEKPKKKEKLLFKKEEKPKAEKKEKEPIKIIEEPIEQKEKERVNKKVSAENLRKERALQRIRRDQEKQRRKIGKSGS